MINLEKMKYELSATPPLPLTPPPLVAYSSSA